MIDTLENLRKEFPLLSQKTPKGKSIIYLDNAATTQKPESVIEAMNNYYRNENANIGRGIYWPATKTTENVRNTRKSIAEYLNCKSDSHIIFTSGTTDGINKIANYYLLPQLNPGDEVIISRLEHHSNILPWLYVCKQTGASLKFLEINNEGVPDIMQLRNLINKKTKLVALTAASNVTGCLPDLHEIIDIAHKNNCKVIVDAAQYIPHSKINVQDLNADFIVFSAHKIYGPTGLGIMYIRNLEDKHLKHFSPGGGMVKEIDFDSFSPLDAPYAFEGGTLPIAEIIGFGSTLEFLSRIDHSVFHKIMESNTSLLKEKLQSINEVDLFYPEIIRIPVFSFSVKNIHPHDMATFLGQQGIAIRAGHMCAKPLIQSLHTDGSVCRVSLGMYNSSEEISNFAQMIKEAIKFFA
ncbi:MAG: aminotransferase class V-fold PLP-dependent enzyme [Cyclobacteriaceae bacterium]|nr:aminotransferase class V-fold PLP-dependent enzyme [Cyclobacteriaceae bacterium]